MFKFIKQILIKRWAGEISKLVEDSRLPEVPREGEKNLSGLGGQGFQPYFISWNQLKYQSKTISKLGSTVYLGEVEHLFFEYFGPLEHWCDANCVGYYFLWSDERGVYRAFIDPIDTILWNLTFEKSMPTMNEIYDIIVDP